MHQIRRAPGSSMRGVIQLPLPSGTSTSLRDGGRSRHRCRDHIERHDPLGRHAVADSAGILRRAPASITRRCRCRRGRTRSTTPRGAGRRVCRPLSHLGLHLPRHPDCRRKRAAILPGRRALRRGGSRDAPLAQVSRRRALPHKSSMDRVAAAWASAWCCSATSASCSPNGSSRRA